MTVFTPAANLTPLDLVNDSRQLEYLNTQPSAVAPDGPFLQLFVILMNNWGDSMHEPRLLLLGRVPGKELFGMRYDSSKREAVEAMMSSCITEPPEQWRDYLRARPEPAEQPDQVMDYARTVSQILGQVP